MYSICLPTDGKNQMAFENLDARETYLKHVKCFSEGQGGNFPINKGYQTYTSIFFFL